MSSEPQQEQVIVQQTVVTTTTVQQPPVGGDQLTNNNIEPIVVLLLNFLFPGIGHIIIGQTGKAIAYIVIYIVGVNIIVFLSFIVIGFILIPFITLWWIFIMVDGFQIASRLKEGRVVRKGECTNAFAKFGVSIFESSEVFVQ